MTKEYFKNGDLKKEFIEASKETTMSDIFNYNIDIQIKSEDIELTIRKISFWLEMQQEVKDFKVYQEPKRKKEICENCKQECKTSPVIWSVPFWFCSHKCKDKFWNTYSCECDIENVRLIIKNRLTGEIYSTQ